MSEPGESLVEKADVTGLGISIAQFPQLGGSLIVGGSDFLIHERVKS